MKNTRKYDKNAINIVEFRKHNLETEFDRIRRIMSGYFEFVYPFIENKKGVIESERIDSVITDMLDALDRYIDTCREKKLSKDQREWYRSYLYCVLVSPDVYTEWLAPEYGYARKFEDIIELTDIDPVLQDPYEFIWYENHSWEDEDDTQRDILFYMAHSYRCLMDKELNEIYTNREKSIYKKLAPSFEWGYNRRRPGMDLLTQIDVEKAEAEEQAEAEEEEHVSRIRMEDEISESEDYLGYDPDSESQLLYEEENEPDPEIMLQIMEEQEKEDQHRFEIAMGTITKWCSHIGDKERFEQEYKNFRKYFFKADLSRMKEDMTHLVDAFLYESGISAYSIDKNYGLVNKAINSAEASIKSAVFRARVLK